MDTPKLKGNQCSLLIAEYATGHVFKKDLTLFLNGQNENEIYQVFDTFESAKEYALNFIQKIPEFEYSIYNYNGKHLATFDKNGKRKFKNRCLEKIKNIWTYWLTIGQRLKHL